MQIEALHRRDEAFNAASRLLSCQSCDVLGKEPWGHIAAWQVPRSRCGTMGPVAKTANGLGWGRGMHASDTHCMHGGEHVSMSTTEEESASLRFGVALL